MDTGVSSDDMRRPVACDLYCGEGGMSTGLDQAGFKVFGVDLYHQGRYPFPFFQSDAVAFVRRHKSELRESCSLIHASPPCQLYSKTARLHDLRRPDLIAQTRDALEDLGIPYVIENVVDAYDYLREPVMLCGGMFGIETYRHRLFEAGCGADLVQPPHPQHIARNAVMGRSPQDGEFMHIVGNFAGVHRARTIMGMPHASRYGLSQAVPACYGLWVGEQVRNNAVHGVR